MMLNCSNRNFAIILFFTLVFCLFLDLQKVEANLYSDSKTISVNLVVHPRINLSVNPVLTELSDIDGFFLCLSSVGVSSFSFHSPGGRKENRLKEVGVFRAVKHEDDSLKLSHGGYLPFHNLHGFVSNSCNSTDDAQFKFKSNGDKGAHLIVAAE